MLRFVELFAAACALAHQPLCVCLTGHSAGGALATLAALDLACAAHMPQSVIMQQLHRRIACFDTSPLDSHVHSTEQRSACAAWPRHDAKQNFSHKLLSAEAACAEAALGFEALDVGSRPLPPLPFLPPLPSVRMQRPSTVSELLI